MLERWLLILGVALGAGCSSGQLHVQVPQAAATPNTDTVDAIAADYWEILLAESPFLATDLGDRRFDDALPDLSVEAREGTLRKKQELQARLHGINAGFLSGEPLITARFLGTMLENTFNRNICQTELWNVDPVAGYHLMIARLPDLQRLDSSAAATAYITRLGRVGALLEQHQANLRLGLTQKYTAPQVMVRRVMAQLRRMIQQKPEASSFLTAVDRATHLDDEERKAVRADVAAAVRETIVPALRSYLNFLETEYIQKARVEVSVAANPNGADCYAALAAHYGGGLSDVRALQDFGQEELGRVQSAMLSVAQNAGKHRTDDYVQSLLRTPAQFATSAAALVQYNRDTVARAQQALPQVVASLPQKPIEVRAMESYREREGPPGYYEPAAADGSRPAYYYVNTYRPQTRPLYNMEVEAFHEALPGHHVQAAIAQDANDLPLIRRYMGPPSFVAGWAMYAERLADELHLYSGPPARFGMLNYQALRASRLVVDSGLHGLNWTREQAVRFVRDNTVLPDDEVENEVDRYIAWPGEALSYAAGGMVFNELRSMAEHKLGARFSLTEFHRQVLRHGAVPIAVLRDAIGGWVLAP